MIHTTTTLILQRGHPVIQTQKTIHFGTLCQLLLQKKSCKYFLVSIEIPAFSKSTQKPLSHMEQLKKSYLAQDPWDTGHESSHLKIMRF